MRTMKQNQMEILEMKTTTSFHDLVCGWIENIDRKYPD